MSGTGLIAGAWLYAGCRAMVLVGPVGCISAEPFMHFVGATAAAALRRIVAGAAVGGDEARATLCLAASKAVL